MFFIGKNKFMDELTQILLTSGLTVIVGVLVYVFGEITKIIFLSPFQKYRKTVAEIDNELKYYANILCNPGMRDKGGNLPKNYLECSERLRRLSCKLEACYKQQLLRSDKSFEKISDSTFRLIRLSNALFHNETVLMNSDDIDRIRENLGIISFEKGKK